MGSTRVWRRAASVVCACAAVGCGVGPEPAHVDYGEGTPLGRWAPQAVAGAVAPSASDTVEHGGTAGVSANVLQANGEAASPRSDGAISGPAADGGASGAADASGTSAASGAADASDTSASPNIGAGSGASDTPQAGADAPGDLSADAGVDAGGAAGADGTPSLPEVTLSSLSFDVTTSPVGYNYQPRNIGAIWIEDSAGQLVKSLEVWAKTRRRYLTRYQSALSGSSVDVTASATLQSHRTHHVSWDLKDKNGATVPPGVYSLVLELTDGNQTGRTTGVEFDTSAGPMTVEPPDAPSFAQMSLQLQ